MIRVGLIGAGFIGRNHFNQYEKLTERARVVALCDKEADRRAGDWSKVGGNLGDAQGTKRDLGSIKPYTAWQDLMADPGIDLVDICTPTFTHREIVTAALRAGKHVLCEKPMALNLDDCDAMLAVAEGAKGQFMIAQCIRFWPEYVYLTQVFQDRRFGALQALQLRRQAETPAYSLNSWVLNPELSGGAILDLHVHDVDYALGLLGRPEAITAQACIQANGASDRVHALWHYAKPQVVQLEGFWDMPTGFGFNMGYTAVFEQAAVQWDLSSGKPVTIYRRDRQPENPELPPGGDGYFNEIDYFLGCAERNERPSVSTPEESRHAVAIGLAEKESAHKGTRVAVQL